MVLLTQTGGEPLTVQAMAARGQIPSPYLSKLLQGLARAGLVVSRRGVGGGYALTRPPSEITLADVVCAVEPLQRIRQCPLGIRGHVVLCPLHRKLDEALASLEAKFRATTLSDLCQEAGGSIPLCDTQATVCLQLPHAVGSIAKPSPDKVAQS